jgi:hypothetical protein
MCKIKRIPDRKDDATVRRRRIVRIRILAGEIFVNRSRITRRPIVFTFQYVRLRLTESRLESDRTSADGCGRGSKHRPTVDEWVFRGLGHGEFPFEHLKDLMTLVSRRRIANSLPLLSQSQIVVRGGWIAATQLPKVGTTYSS